MDVTLFDGGYGITLAGNTHRRTLTSYTITPYTVIEFTYSSTAVGEVQGLGFESDTSLSSNRIFKLQGTQNWAISGFTYTGAGAPQSFTIPVGQYYTGTGMNLVLSNDHDAGVANSNGTFTNVRIYESVPPPITVDFTGNHESFSSSQDEDMDATVINGGAGLALAGNTHRRTLTSYTITPYTVIEFTYSSTAVGEVQGLGFESDSSISSNRIFRLAGTQNWGINDFVYTGAGAPQSFSIPVGTYYTGSGMNLVLSNDHDAGVANSNGTFTNVRILEVVPPGP
jgi:hypothetical protein